MPSAPDEVRQVALLIAATLERNGIQDSRLEAEVLLRHALQYDRAQFYASLRESISAECLEIAQALTARRVSGEPLAYITGLREFYGLGFLVNASVLIPRQETELLVDHALQFAREYHDDTLSVADVGAGSGAIAITIATNVPEARVYATDCSADALTVADHNRRKHSVADRVRLLHGDLLAPLPCAVDLIVSNPPYVASDLLPTLPTEVQREPLLALDGGEQGLEIIRRLLIQAPSKLEERGRLIIEISPEQLKPVSAMAQAHFPNADICHANDLLGLPRCVSITT